MVSPVSTGGYQAYSYTQATNPLQQEAPRGGENRVEARQAPAGDSQRSDRRELASKDESAPRSAPKDSGDGARGKVVDFQV